MRTPAIAETNDNGGCHSRKHTVCQKHRFHNPDQKGGCALASPRVSRHGTRFPDIWIVRLVLSGERPTKQVHSTFCWQATHEEMPLLPFPGPGQETSRIVEQCKCLMTLVWVSVYAIAYSLLTLPPSPLQEEERSHQIEYHCA